MNVYDDARQLAKSIKDSEEYAAYKRAEVVAFKSESVKQMIDDFHKKQYELQRRQLMGEEPSEFEMKQLQKLVEVVSVDPVARDFLSAEMRFTLMMQDISKILGEVMEL